MTNNKTTLEEQGAAINASIRDLEHEVLRMDEAALCQELVDRIITLKDARETINWLRRACTFVDAFTASAMVKVHNALNPKNQAKIGSFEEAFGGDGGVSS